MFFDGSMLVLAPVVALASYLAPTQAGQDGAGAGDGSSSGVLMMLTLGASFLVLGIVSLAYYA
jgi:hypothetical protein